MPRNDGATRRLSKGEKERRRRAALRALAQDQQRERSRVLGHRQPSP